LNYDGKGSNITGADFISSSTSNIELVSSFVYDNSRTKTTFVVLTNKIASGPVNVIIDVSTITPSGQVSLFSFGKGSRLQPSGRGSLTNGQVLYQAPPWSATLAVINY